MVPLHPDSSKGTYPDTSLVKARDARNEARKLIAQGIDRGADRKAAKEVQAALTKNCFEIVCREWLDKRKSTVEPAQHVKTLARMVNDVFPWLGAKPITEITAPDVLAVLRRIDERGAHFTVHRVRSEISRAFGYAIATGRAERDPCPERLGWQAGIANPCGGKPRGMHWRTFNRLTAEHDAFVGVSMAGPSSGLLAWAAS